MSETETELTRGQRAVLGVLQTIGPACDEILVSTYQAMWNSAKGAIPRMTPSGIRSRRAELVRKVKVQWTGLYQRMSTGGKGRVWQALAILALVVLQGCLPPTQAYASELRVGKMPPPKTVRAVELPALAVVQAPAGTDTLVVDAAWTNPVDDGKGKIDSMSVRLDGWTSQIRRVVTGPTFPASQSFRLPIDYTLNSGGSATWNLRVCVGVFRYGLYAETCSAEVPFTLTYPPPPTATGITIQVRKVP